MAFPKVKRQCECEVGTVSGWIKHSARDLRFGIHLLTQVVLTSGIARSKENASAALKPRSHRLVGLGAISAQTLATTAKTTSSAKSTSDSISAKPRIIIV